MKEFPLPLWERVGRGGKILVPRQRAYSLLSAATLVLAVICSLASGSLSAAPEKQKVTIAVGGKAALYYLPLTLAERLGYFKDEGLDVQILDFAGGSKALAGNDGRQRRCGGRRLRPRDHPAREGTEAEGLRAHGGHPFAGAGNFEGTCRHLQVATRSQRHEDRCHRAWLEHQHLRQSPPGERWFEPRRRVHHRCRYRTDCGCGDARWPDRRHRERRARHHHAGALGNDQGGRRNYERAGIAGGIRQPAAVRIAVHEGGVHSTLSRDRRKP